LIVNSEFLEIQVLQFLYRSFVTHSGLWGVSAVCTFSKHHPPPGSRFNTFQEVAYIVDVYNRKIEPADRFIDYALFISLFPT